MPSEPVDAAYNFSNDRGTQKQSCIERYDKIHNIQDCEGATSVLMVSMCARHCAYQFINSPMQKACLKACAKVLLVLCSS